MTATSREEPAFPGGIRGFLAEARRRRVYIALAAYVAVGAGTIQLVGPITDSLILPDWTPRLVTVLVILGLPVVLVLAWVFDVTSEGVKRATGPDGPPRDQAQEAVSASNAVSSPPKTSRALRVGSPLPALPRRPRRSVDLRPAAGEDSPALDAEGDRRASLAHLRHELRTPINGIIGYAEMVLEDTEDEGLSEDLRQILVTGTRLLQVVDRELDAGAAEDGAGGTLTERMAAVRSRVQGPTTALIARVADMVPRAREGGDVGGVVQDLERIRDAARRLLDTVEQATDGANDPSHLPSRGPELTREVLSKVRPSPTQRPGLHGAGGGRVLVVDDDPQNRDLLSRGLARAGYMVATAEDGAGALQRLREQNFDVVLLDVIMPGMDGVEALRRIRNDEALQEIPVIMLSSLDEVDSVVRCVEMGAEEYLVKPVQPPVLDARIAANIELRQMRAMGRGYQERLEADEAFIERLLSAAFPARFARRLQRGELDSEERFPETTALCCLMTRPDRDGAGLRDLYPAVEGLARRLDVELCLWGPARFLALADAGGQSGRHAAQMAELGLAILAEGNAVAPGVRLRVGVHTGSAWAGILGRDRFRFDLWGEAPEVAAEAAREAPEGGILVTAAACPLLLDGFQLRRHGVVELSGHGQTTVHRLLGTAAAV